MVSFDVYNENNADWICNYSSQRFMLWFSSTRESDLLMLGEHIEKFAKPSIMQPICDAKMSMA